VVRANALAALENMPLWHERDISHSSVERVIGPDSTILVHYMLRKMTKMMEHLIVYPENMMRNLEKTEGLIFSQSVLLALVEKGIAREEAYKLVQKNAMQSWMKGKDFLTLLKKDKKIRCLMTEREIEKIFNLKSQFKNVDFIFKRIFKK
jgi:adenylosuccinate lyase